MTFANPAETIEPSTGHDALQTATRYMITSMPRADIIKLVESMDPYKVVEAVKGNPRELSPLELTLSGVIDHYSGESFGNNPLFAIVALEGLKEAVRDGEVFMGEPWPASYYEGLNNKTSTTEIADTPATELEHA